MICLDPYPSPQPPVIGLGVAASLDPESVDPVESTREKVEWSYDSACEVCSVGVGSVRQGSVRWEFQVATMKVEVAAG